MGRKEEEEEAAVAAAEHVKNWVNRRTRRVQVALFVMPPSFPIIPLFVHVKWGYSSQLPICAIPGWIGLEFAQLLAYS